MLAHVSSRMNPTAPSSDSSAGRAAPTTCSRSGATATSKSRFVSRIRACEAVRDGVHLGAGALEADAGLQPRDRPEVVAAAVLEVVRPHRDPENRSAPRSPRARWPETRMTGASRRRSCGRRRRPPGSARPRAGLPPNCRSHSAWLITATRAAGPAGPRPRTNVRPSTGGTRSTANNRSVTSSATAPSGCLPPTIVTSWNRYAAICSNTRLPLCQSRKLRERHPVGLPALALPRLVQLHERIGIPVIERSQHDGVHEAEHGGRHADAQCERQHDRQREPGVVRRASGPRTARRAARPPARRTIWRRAARPSPPRRRRSPAGDGALRRRA